MAQAYQLIQTTTLTGSAASVTIGNIPQNYTDLYLKINARSSSSTGLSRAIRMQINGDTTYSNYRQRYIGISDTNTATAGAFTSSTGLQYYLYGLPTANSTTYSFGATDINFINYSGSSYKTISSESFTEGFANPFSSGTAAAGLTAILWVNTAAITSLVFTPDDSSNFVSGSSFALYGIGGTKASGGTITADSQYTYHTFTSSGTFTALEKIKGAEVLMVAGGGAGGSQSNNDAYGGGGGAGGIVYIPGQTLNAGTSYTAAIGAGGTPIGNQPGNNGNRSSFFSLTSDIGGGGGGSFGGAYPVAGANGGSGGGAGSYYTTPAPSGGTATSGQGNNGGAGTTVQDGTAASGGGGGAGAVGTAGASGVGGNGGNGTTNYSAWGYATSTGVLSGGMYYYAGGGGGAGRTSGGIGGIGGGAAGRKADATSQVAANGTANTGGGGGGCGRDANLGYNGTGGSGGSGLVIIRYPN